MNCKKCGVKCNEIISSDRKFCEECKCSKLSHYDSSLIDRLSNDLIMELCSINNAMVKSIEDVSKLAKTFGVMWLPFGIQPSEVDRFLKCFPVNSEIRIAMFTKSEKRSMEIQLQTPIHDRCRNNMLYLNGEKEIDRCNNFLIERKEKYANVGRLDHLDNGEGKACKECSDVISFGEMSVILPRQFQKDSLVWHPNCFKCIQCQHILIDYIFCWDSRDDSGPYCLRHFDDRHFPRCGNCDEMIFEDEYASVLDECFHIEHLRCDKCDSLLANTQFILDSDSSSTYKLWKCVSCLTVPKTDSCFICNTALNESLNIIIDIDGFGAHKACISCDSCHQLLPISDPATFKKDDINQFFCSNCKSSRKIGQCRDCKEDIDMNDKTNIINGRFMWHQRCLHCCVCKKALLEGDQFTVIDITGKISRACKPNLENASAICKECFITKHEDKCDICLKQLNEDGVKYQSKLFHKSCLKCHNCLSNIDPSKFTTSDNNIYCLNCYGQLYCNICFSCKLPIIGGNEDNYKMVNFETRYWHQECFICFQCKKSLLEIGFLFGDDRISCINCEIK